MKNEKSFIEKQPLNLINNSYFCLNCGEEILEDYKTGFPIDKNNPPKYCCKKCALTYASHCVDTSKTKLLECTVCHEIKEANILVSSKNFVCNDCKANEIDRIKENRLKEKNYEPYICLTCGNPFTEDYRKDIRGVKKEEPRFCCQPCAAKYSSSCIDQNKTKLVECTICHELKEVNVHASSINFICDECKTNQIQKEKEEKIKLIYKNTQKSLPVNIKDSLDKKVKRSSIKKNTFKNKVLNIPYLYSEDCILGRFERSRTYKQKSDNLRKIGFNFDNLNWGEEFFKARNLLYKVYYEEKQSILMLKEYFNLKSTRTVTDLLHLFGFSKTRNNSEGVRLAFKEGRNTPLNEYSDIYNQNWIDTPYGKFFYRSNYELSLIKFLVERNIEFTCNKTHISYISSEDNEEHSGYPDFYLPKYNVLIETKNRHNFEEQNLIDRYETGIKPKGIDFIVISCKGKYAYKTREFIFKGFKVLKSFIEDKEKEKQILDLLEIKE